jgi:glycosyltransferase involved in cell wall biosynthesis
MTEKQKPFQKQKLLWYAHRFFDTSVDSATWLEMLKELNGVYSVELYTLWNANPKDIEYLPGKKVHYMSQYGQGILKRIIRTVLPALEIRNVIYEYSPSVILVNTTRVFVLKAIKYYAAKNGSLVVYDIRTLPTKSNDSGEWSRFEKCLRYAAKHLNGVTYITQRLYEYCQDRFTLDSHRYGIWSSAVNTSLFCPTKRSMEYTFRVIYHGGIISRCRGLDKLISAMQLLKEYPIALTLVSSLRDDDIVIMRTELGLNDTVTFVNTVPHEDVPALINNHDIGVLPFPRNDAWDTSSPLKLFEYLACGKPVVVTNIPAHYDLLAEKEFAFFAEASSAESLAKAILKAYEMRDSFPAKSKLARSFAVNNCTWRVQSKYLIHFLKSLD